MPLPALGDTILLSAPSARPGFSALLSGSGLSSGAPVRWPAGEVCNNSSTNRGIHTCKALYMHETE